MAITLNTIHSVRATNEPDVYIVNCSITDDEGTYDAEYATSPEGVYGLNPAIRQWLVDNEGDYTIEPYVPPTTEETRASMPKLSARQFRLGFVMAGHSLSSIDAAIEAISEPQEREVARIEWEYATEYKRLHPLVASIAAGLGLTDAQIDEMWTSAQNL
jgi:hypothetical protein